MANPGTSTEVPAKDLLTHTRYEVAGVPIWIALEEEQTRPLQDEALRGECAHPPPEEMLERPIHLPLGPGKYQGSRENPTKTRKIMPISRSCCLPGA